MAEQIGHPGVRGWTAARLLETASPAETAAARARLDPQGRLAALLPELAPATPDAPRPAVAAAVHPSWHAAALCALPAAAARTYLDRLAPDAARAVLGTLDPRTARILVATPAAGTSPLAEALLGRFGAPAFPPPPAWALPAGEPRRVARAAALDEWPFAPEVGRAEDPAARAALASSTEQGGPGPAEARGLARLAFALQRQPDEAWGLAGAWPRMDGLALLAAWNAWPDLLPADETLRTATVAAHRRIVERWSTWAA